MKELYYINDVNVDEDVFDKLLTEYKKEKRKFTCQSNTTYHFPEKDSTKDTRIYIIKDILEEK